MRAILINTVVAAVLLAASWLVYGSTLHAPFLLDDLPAISNNPAIRSMWPPWEPLFPPPAMLSFSRRPVANLTMAWNFALGDVAVEGYRVFNLVLHAVNAWLLFLLLQLVLARMQPPLPGRAATWAAAAAGLLWVVHPLATSAVHYLTQRPEMLVATGFLFMCYAQLRALEGCHTRLWLAMAALACLLGMGSKESMALAPVLAVLLDRCATRWTWREQLQRRWVYYAALFATLAWPLWRVMINADDVAGPSDLESRWRYFMTVSEGVVRHAWLTLWPQHLVFDYGMQLTRSWTDVWWHLLIVAGAAGAVLAGLWKRSLAAWAGAAIFALLLPSWLVVVGGQPVAEHRFYLPLGLLVGLGTGAVAVGLLRTSQRQLVAAAAVVLVVAAFTWTARQRAALYTQPAELMRSDITAWPRNERGHYNLGLALEYQGDFDEAAENYAKAYRIAGGADWRLISSFARIKLRQGDLETGIWAFEDGLRRMTDTEEVRNLQTYLAVMISSFRSAGHLQEVVPILERATRHPEHGQSFEQPLLATRAEVEGAEGAITTLTAAADDDPMARINLAVALARSDRPAEGVEQLDLLLAELGDNADKGSLAEVWSLRGALLDENHDLPEKVKSLRRAIALDPNHAEALNNLAWLHATTRDSNFYDPQEAVNLSRKACRLAGGQAFFYGTLAVASAAAGDTAGAEEAADRARHAAKMAGIDLPDLEENLRKAAARARGM